MQSLRKRFNGTRQEVLDYVETYGVFAGMTKFDVRDYSALKRWLKEETGNENFGISPKLNKYPGEDAFDKLARALIRVISEVQADSKRVHAENKILWQIVRERGAEDEQKALFALEMVATL